MTAPGPEARSLVVGVVGAGTMGAGIAQVCLAAGHEVVVHDVDASAVDRGRARIQQGLERLVDKGRLDPLERDRALARLRQATTLGAVAEGADVVIEAAVEDLALKQDVFRALDEAAPADSLLATNTSALSVSAIASALTRPQRVLGLHFFNPAPVMPLVEVVQGDATERAAVERAVGFVEGLGKEAIPCRDAPGFIVNRVNRPFTLEPLRMLQSGQGDVEGIDAAVRAAGYPMGPFALMDLVGIDVNYAVARALYEAFDEALRFRPSPVQEALVEAGRLGRKAGVGFYRYGSDGQVQGVEELPDALRPPRTTTPLDPDAIVEWIELAIVNEAYHAAGEDVAAPPDIDRAMKLGANHPHGPFERAREIGLGTVVRRLAELRRAYGDRFLIAPALLRIASI